MGVRGHRHKEAACSCGRPVNVPATRLSRPPFFRWGAVFPGTSRTSVRLDMSSIERSAIPVDLPGGIGLGLQLPQNALPEGGLPHHSCKNST